MTYQRRSPVGVSTNRAGARRRDPVPLAHRGRGLRGQRAAARLARGRPATSSTPAAGHGGATAIKNEPAAAIASDNDYMITKCGILRLAPVSRETALN